VGGEALAPRPPHLIEKLVGTLRFAHPTTLLNQI
jgi:hypothetical protein